MSPSFFGIATMTRKLFPLSAALLLALAGTSQAEDGKTPGIKGVVAEGTRIELIKEGFEGTEGPIGLPDGSLIFTETPANRITRIAADGTTSTFLDNTNGSNGLGFSSSGELISVQRVKPQVGVIFPAGKEKVLTDQFDGTPYAQPNDLVVGHHAGIFFTDPGAQPKPGEPAPHPAVYHINRAGEVKRIIVDVRRTNGIQLSTDEKTLYVASTAGEYVLAYDVAPDGSISNKRNFANLKAGVSKTDTGTLSSGADGLAIDSQGRLRNRDLFQQGRGARHSS